eukprot:11471320-Prorocentrum_lima.AAC.1
MQDVRLHGPRPSSNQCSGLLTSSPRRPADSAGAGKRSVLRGGTRVGIRAVLFHSCFLRRPPWVRPCPGLRGPSRMGWLAHTFFDLSLIHI